MKETILLTDGYKLGHHFQYPKGTEIVTHMVNRKGIENLAKTFNKVYFTNSYRTWDNLPDNVIQIEIV